MPSDDRLDSILDAWQCGFEAGREVPAAELCRECPDLLPEAERRIDLLRRMAGLRRAPDPDRAATVDHAATADASPDMATTALFGGRVEADQEAGPRAPAGFEIVGELGRGGMGVVYRARQAGLNRDVALKMLLAGPYAHPALRARFLVEAETVAALEHPNVVKVFAFGEHAGHPYLAMEFLPGGTLAERAKASGPLPGREAAALVAKLAGAVVHAHSRGVVHRDIKPHNVLFGADGEPRLADFGLAKVGRSDLTVTGQVLGTPAYMAPEQAAGKVNEVGTAADVYALGAVLYDLLTGRPPFLGNSHAVTLQKVIAEEPVRPRALVPAVPRDLETVCLKCLEKDPAKRYSAAQALTDELDRYGRGEPVQARPAGWTERLVRWVARKPAAAAAYGFSSLAVLLAIVVFVVSGFWREAEGAKEAAERAKGDADSARDDAVRLGGIAESARTGEAAAKAEAERQRERIARIEYGRTIQLAYQAWMDGWGDRARTLLAGTRPDLRGWEYRFVHRLCQPLERVKSPAVGEWSADGSRVLAGDSVWDPNTGRTLSQLGADPARPRFISSAWSPDESKVLTVRAPEGRRRKKGDVEPELAWSVVVWNPATGNRLDELAAFAQGVNSAAWSPDGSKILVAAYGDKVAYVWTPGGGKGPVALEAHPHPVVSAVWSPDGGKVLTASHQPAEVHAVVTVLVMDAAGKLTARLEHESADEKRGWWSSDGSKVLTHVGDTARVTDALTGKTLAERKHAGSVAYSLWSPDGSKVLTGVRVGRDTLSHVWEAATGRALATFRGGGPTRWSPDGSRVFTGDGVWDVTTGKRTSEIRITGHVESVEWGGGGSKILAVTEFVSGPLSADNHYSARAWDAATGRLVVDLKVTEAAWSRDRSKVYAAMADGRFLVWDAVTGQTRAEPHGGAGNWSPDGSKVLLRFPAGGVWDTTARAVVELEGWVVPTSWNRDGSRVVTVEENRALVWDAETGKRLGTVSHDSALQPALRSPQWSPDGTQVLAFARGGTVRTADATTGRTLAEFKCPSGRSFHSTSWSPDGRRALAISLGDHDPQERAALTATVHVWDPASGKAATELPFQWWHPATEATAPAGAQAAVVAAWSPDGVRLAVDDGKVARVWDPATGQTVVGFTSAVRAHRSVAWSPDGSKVFTMLPDGTVAWDAATGRTVARLDGQALLTFVRADGSVVVVRGQTGVSVWDTAASRSIALLAGAGRDTTNASVSPDGRRVLTAGREDTVRLWDVESGAELLALPGGSPFARFSPDGTRILINDRDGRTALVYDSRPLRRTPAQPPLSPPAKP